MSQQQVDKYCNLYSTTKMVARMVLHSAVGGYASFSRRMKKATGAFADGFRFESK
jgi:hypothetical protein